ncbi:MAG: PAS domain S-box protein [Anaerolineae bacterium]
MVSRSVATQMGAARRDIEHMRNQARALALEQPLLQESLASLSSGLDRLDAMIESLRNQNIELERVQDELATERQRYGLAFLSAPDAHLITSLRGTIQAANEAASHLLGVAADAALPGKRLATFVDSRDRLSFSQGLDDILQKGRLTDWALTLRPPDSAPIHVSCTVGTAPDHTGKPTQLFWALCDISTRMRAYRERTHAEQLLANLLDANPAAVAWLSAQDLIIRWANPSFLNLAPSAVRGEIIGKPYGEVFPPSQGFVEAEVARHVRDSGDSAQVDRLIYQGPDGATRTYSLRITPAPQDDEPGMLLTMWDTTPIEQVIRRTERAAEQVRQREIELDAVFRAAAEAIIVYDAGGTPVRANPAAVRAYGFDPVGLDRRQVAQRLNLRYPDGSPVPFDQVASSRGLRGETLQGVRFLMHGADDQDRIILSSTAPLFVNGDMRGAVLLWADITEREKLLEQSQWQRTLLERLMANAPVGMAVVRVPEMRYELANPAYEAIPGMEHPVLHRTMAQVLPKAAAGAALGLVEQAVQQRQTISVREMETSGKNGLPVSYWDVDHVPLLNAEGQVERVLMIVHDATDQVLARRHFAELASRSAAILESMAEAVTVFDLQGRLVHANAAALRLMGVDDLEHANLEPEAVADIFSMAYSDGRPLSLEEWPASRVLAGESFSGLELWVTRSDLGKQWIGSFSGTPVYDSDGRIFLGVVVAHDITARKMAEAERERLIAELDAERARLSTIIQNAPEGILVADDQGRIVLANAAAQALYGETPQLPIDLRQMDSILVRRADGARIERSEYTIVRAALYGETHMDEETTLALPDGKEVDLLGNTAPIRDSQGRIAGAVTLFRDVTERKKAQQAIERLAQRLQGLHDTDRAILSASSAEDIAEAALFHLGKLVPHVRSSVVLFNPDNELADILAVREGKSGFLRGSRFPISWFARWIDLTQGDNVVIENLEGVEKPTPLQRALIGAGVQSTVSIALRAEGRTMGVLNLGMAEPGRPSDEPIAILQELADQLAVGIRQAQLHEQVQRYAQELENRVEQRTAQLRASESRFQTLFHQAGLGMTIMDVQGRFLEANQALQEMSGYPPEEVLGHRFTQHIYPEDLDDARDKWRGLVTGQYSTYRAEHRYVRRDGQVIWASLTVSLVRGADQAHPFIVAMVQDITEQRRAQAALIQSEKLAVTGRLATSLVHEINNPLQSVIGCLGLAEETLAEGGDVSRYLRVARDELQRAARIVGDLRDLHRPARSKEKEPTDVNALLERVLALSAKRLRDNAVDVQLDLAADLPAASMVRDRIQQVFVNLVLNAIDAMPNGGSLQVRTQATTSPEGIAISFSDTGYGIPQDVLSNIFAPFFSTKPDGLGLGLYVSHNIVAQHGGTLEASSAPGQGTTFTVWLPA